MTKTRKLYAKLETEIRVTKIDTTTVRGRPYVEFVVDDKSFRFYEHEVGKITLEGSYDNPATPQ